MTKPLVDQHGRVISHLRVSLTDQCNFRCVYCMPPEGVATLPKAQHLICDEIVHLTKIFCDLGVNKIRLSGGEPLLREDIVNLVQDLSQVQGIDCLALTTNGSYLERLAKPLFEAGLQRINISLDSLNKKTFSKMALRDSFHEVMAGLDETLQLGFPVKINVVVMKGMNDHEMDDFLDFAVTSGVEEVRFIEFMPLCGTGWKPQYVYSLQPVIKKITEQDSAVPFIHETDSVAKSFIIRRQGKIGRVGFITTLSNPFCGQCSRIRLSADGFLRPCLFSHDGVSLKNLLRANVEKEQIIQAIQQAVWQKKSGNEFYLADQKHETLGSYLEQRPIAYRESNPVIRSIGG